MTNRSRTDIIAQIIGTVNDHGEDMIMGLHRLQ